LRKKVFFCLQNRKQISLENTKPTRISEGSSQTFSAAKKFLIRKHLVRKPEKRGISGMIKNFMLHDLK
jgi:hypothetical protein